MNTYSFHITVYDLLLLGTIFIGLMFAALLGFTKSINRPAKRFLGLALAVVVFWMIRILSTGIRIGNYPPYAGWLPLQFSLAFGPLIYFYVLKLTRPERTFGWKDLLHLIPVLLEQVVRMFTAKEAMDTGAVMLISRQLPFLFQWLTFLSVTIYLYWSHRLIEDFYKRLKFNDGDRYRNELRWLHRLLGCFGLLWLLWLPYAAVNYFGYHNALELHAYYPLYLLLAVTIIWIGAVSFLRPEVESQGEIAPVSKPSASRELRQKGTWLKKAMEARQYYQDPELSLSSLAKKLDLHPHELSRIINTALKKNFNDFVNEFRVTEVIRKMQDPANDRLTLLGIAYDSGFNSKATFNRTFRQIIGKSPVEYKINLKKERSTYDLRPYADSTAIISYRQTIPKWSYEKLNRSYMFKNYLKLAWRNLLRNSVSSLINVGGLAIGMAVVILIGLWVYDEMSFNKYHQHYDRIAQVLETQGISGALQTQTQIPIPVATVLRNKFGSDFKQILLSSQTEGHILTFKENKLSKTGNFMEPQAPGMLTLQMLEGSRNGLSDMHSILLSASLSKALFGTAGALGQTIRMDDSLLVKVTGVYQDLPQNSSFHDLAFIAPWDLYVHADQETRNSAQQWQDNNWQVFVQLADHADLPSLSAKIKNIKADNDNYLKTHHNAIAQMLLQPMSKWHLYADFKDGVNTGGRIQYVRLFALIGIFVLLLACINFMNLSTARSEKRAKEVGIRKAMGSVRTQLIIQFFSESILVVVFAFMLSLGLVALSLPWFNDVAGKQVGLPWGNTTLWLLAAAFVLVTGLIAGSYPAFYLSSFQPVKVLKGMFRTGRLAALPRKVLVVVQFTVSMVLIIGTIIVFRQIQFARNRPIGYNRQGLVTIDTHTKAIYDHFAAFRNDMLATGAITEVAESTAPTTEMRNSQGNFSWNGKDPKNDPAFATVGVNPQYAQTIGLKFTEGRNFRTGPAGYDAVTMVISESAAKQMGFKHPIGENIKWMGAKFTVVGVVKDMVMDSPYDPAVPTIFYVAPWTMNTVTFRINPTMNPAAALKKIAPVFARYNPAEPFDYHFVDLTYDAKFRAEQRVGQLAAIFAGLAIFVSCLGLFGLASYVAEQRAKEIGVRKVLGATVFNLWGMLSKDFVGLVGLSCVLAIPIAWYALHSWLQQYPYHTAISWWIFMVTALGAVLITLLTVSYQSIKAALTNPVKSLRSE